MVVAAGITPFLPGLSIYRGLTLLATDASAALLAMVTAAAIAIALSSGAILGEYLAQPIRRRPDAWRASSPVRAWSARTPCTACAVGGSHGPTAEVRCAHAFPGSPTERARTARSAPLERSGGVSAGRQ